VTSKRRRSRHISAPAELLERRILPAISITRFFDGIHELEVVGRAGDGNWRATGFDLDSVDIDTFAADTEILAHWSTAVDWRHVRWGDFDGDGLDDVAGWDPSSGYWWTSLSDGIGSTTVLSGRWTNATSWLDVGVIDLAAAGDRDTQGHFTNKADLAGRTSSGQWWAAVSNGDGTFTNRLLTTWDPSAGWRDIQFVDYNNDGATDIVGRTATGQWWAARNMDAHGFTFFQNVALGTWNESFGWHDVVNVRNFFRNNDGYESIFGRANDGTWNVLRVANEGVLSGPIAQWNEAAGWRDVFAVDGIPGVSLGSIFGRTATGLWYELKMNGAGTQILTSPIVQWNEAAGWHDVQYFKSEASGQTGIIGRNNAGEWWWSTTHLGFGNNVTLKVGQWPPANWRDVSVANVTRAPVTAVHTWITSAGFDYQIEVEIHGHRKGTVVSVIDAMDGSTPGMQVAFAVPASGFSRNYLILANHGTPDGMMGVHWITQFDGHYGVDAYTNDSTRTSVQNRGPSYARGWAGDDDLDATNGVYDELYGGDGVDTLVGDPGDLLMQDV
jgi:hypothetical protein